MWSEKKPNKKRAHEISNQTKLICGDRGHNVVTFVEALMRKYQGTCRGSIEIVYLDLLVVIAWVYT